MQDCPDDLYEKQRQISRIIKTFSYWGDSEINAPNYVEPYHGDPYSYYDYEYWEEDMELPYSYDTFYYPGYDEEY